MRKLMIVLTLAVSFLAASGVANAAGAPPDCGDDCPVISWWPW